MNHLARYLSFLGLSGLIAGTGFFCALRLNDTKGARTLLAIAAAIVPVHFLQLGALIYSRVAYHLPSMPQYLIWTAPSIESLLIVLSIALVALIPITYISFCTLARQRAGSLTAIYLLTCAQLLIPVRDPAAISIALAFSFLILVCGFIKRLEGVTCMRTFEGMLCQIMLALPLLSLVVRQLYLYSANDTLWGVVNAAMAVIFVSVIPRATQDPDKTFTLQLVGSVFALSSTRLLVTPFIESFGLSETLPHLLNYLPYAVVLYALSFLVTGMRGIYRFSATTLIALGVILEVVFTHNLSGLSICLILSMIIIVLAYAQRATYQFGVSIVCFAFSLLRFVQHAVLYSSISPWLSLAILGLLTVVLGSYVERDSSKLRALYLATKSRFGISSAS